MVIKTDRGWRGKDAFYASAEEAHQSYARGFSWPRRTGQTVLAPPVPEVPASGRKLKIFLCHAHEDKVVIREIYRGLASFGVAPWLDEENLLPGQRWRQEISKAIRETDVVLACLSAKSTTKRGHVQKELREALDEADHRPDGAIFLIPLLLEDCPVPDRLSDLHAVHYDQSGVRLLARVLEARARAIGATIPGEPPNTPLQPTPPLAPEQPR